MADDDPDVLLRVPAKLQKAPKAPLVDGTVTVTPARVLFAPTDPTSAVAAAVDVASLTANQRSKAGAPIAMVRFVSPSSALILQFASEQERDTLSDQVAGLLAKLKAKGKEAEGTAASAPGGGNPALPAKRPPPIDAAARKRLLSNNKELQALHDELVGKQVVSEAEFWHTRRQLFESATAKQGAGQRLGIANGMMAEVRPTSDGRSNTVKFNLTPEMMHQIFAEKPAVRQAYLTHVPEKMSEREFWTRYCRSQYFLRVRKGGPAQGEEEAEDMAMFTDRGAAEALAANRLKGIDPTVNLAADRGDGLAEGFGTRRDGAKEPAPPRDDDGLPENPSSKAAVIRDINRHAAVVLDGRPSAINADAQTSVVLAALTRQEKNLTTAGDVDAVGAQWQRTVQEREAGTMEDLMGDAQPQTEALNIHDARRYFDGGSLGGAAAATAGASLPSAEEEAAKVARVREDAAALAWDRVVRDSPMPAGFGPRVLGELTHHIAVASGKLEEDGAAAGAVSTALPAATYTELLQASRTSQELLRHFWAQQPMGTAVQAAKAERIRTAMAALYDRMQETKDALPSAQVNAASRFLRPVFAPLDAAFIYHDNLKQAAGT